MCPAIDRYRGSTAAPKRETAAAAGPASLYLAARTAGEVDDCALFPRSFARRDAITGKNMADYEAALAAADDEHAMQRVLEANPCLLV